MSNGKWRIALVLMIGGGTAIGCSNESGTPSTGTSEQAAAGVSAIVLKRDVPQTPEAAVKAVIDGLKTGKPVAAWNALGDPQQEELNRMVRSYSALVDTQVWNRTVPALKKLVVLLETKKDFILASSLLKSDKRIKIDEIKAKWDPAVKMLRTIVDSELVDQEKMKQFDGRAFLEGTGARIYSQVREWTKGSKDDPFRTFDEMKATVTESGPGKANLELTLRNAKPVKLSLSISGGKWICDQTMFVGPAARSYLREYEGRFSYYAVVEWKDDYLKEMDRIGRAIDKLQACKTSEEFQTAAFQQIFPIVFSLTSRFSGKSKRTRLQEQSESRTKETAMIVIKGDHFADEPAVMAMAKLLDRTANERKGLRYGPTVLDQMTVFLIRPLDDIGELAKKIESGKVTKIDTKRNMLTVEVPASSAAP